MNTFLPFRRVALMLFSLVLLALLARAATPERALSVVETPAPMADKDRDKDKDKDKKHTTHTITISYDATANPQWSYTISPANDAKKSRVKRHDTIVWRCDSGSWKVYFKGPTPLANSSGGDLTYVGGAAGVSAGGEVAEKVKKGDEYEYGVSLLLPGASEPVIDDPRIVIEN